MITLTISGIDEAIARTERLDAAIQASVTAALDRLGALMTSEMVETHEFVNRTGTLERSIGYRVETWRDEQTVLLVYATAWYAQLVEAGHPRARPYPFFWPVFYKYLDMGVQMVAEAVQEAWNAAEGDARG